MVFLYHLRWIAGEPKLLFLGIDWVEILKRFDIGVCLFFVLSGYLLSGPFWEGVFNDRWPNLERYAIRRLSRILPAYWCVLIVFGLFSKSTYSMWGSLALMLQAVGLHTFADYSYHGIVPVLWSIGIEIQYYAVLPALFIAANAIARRYRPWIPLILVALIFGSDLLWRFADLSLVGRLPGKLLPDGSSPVITASVFYYLKWFGIGIAASGIIRSSLVQWKALHWDLMMCLGVAGVIVAIAFSSEGEWHRVAEWGWPFSAMACGIVVFSAPRSRLAVTILEHSVMRFLGSISYGLYLWHWPLLKAVFGGTLPERLGSVKAFFVCGALALLLTITFAWLVYSVIERPAIAWASRQRSFAGAKRALLQPL